MLVGRVAVRLACFLQHLLQIVVGLSLRSPSHATFLADITGGTTIIIHSIVLGLPVEASLEGALRAGH